MGTEIFDTKHDSKTKDTDKGLSNCVSMGTEIFDTKHDSKTKDTDKSSVPLSAFVCNYFAFVL